MNSFEISEEASSNPLINSDGGSTAATQEDKPDYWPMVWSEKEALFAACSTYKNETHLILSGNGGGARIGKPANSSRLKNGGGQLGLSTNSLLINLSLFEAIFDTLDVMERHIKYLKTSKRLTDHISMEGNGYKTFALEDDGRYRLTFLVFNNSSLGLARFFNQFLTTGRGLNQMILAKNSLLMFPSMESLYKDLRQVFDAAIMSHAKKQEFVGMCYFILSQMARLSDDEFEEMLKFPQKIERKISCYFQEGLDYLPEKKRISIINQKMRFRSMVSFDEQTLRSVRIGAKKFHRFYYEQRSIPYYLGDSVEFEKDLPASQDVLAEFSDCEEAEIPHSPSPADSKEIKKKSAPQSLKELVKQAIEISDQPEVQKESQKEESKAATGKKRRPAAAGSPKEGTTKRRNIQVISYE